MKRLTVAATAVATAMNVTFFALAIMTIAVRTFDDAGGASAATAALAMSAAMSASLAVSTTSGLHRGKVHGSHRKHGNEQCQAELHVDEIDESSFSLIFFSRTLQVRPELPYFW